MSGFFIVFLISVPVFYIVGIVAAIGALRGKNSKFASPNTREEWLRFVLSEITNKVSASPDMTARELLNEYEKELKSNDNPVSTGQVAPSTTPVERHTASYSPSEIKWTNWYAENSINLLLYIGAFLIVAAASVLVGFSWQSYTGTTKSVLLLAASLLFLTGGFTLNYIPKVRMAGIIFSAVGTILIPIVGLGWYNFVFQFSGVPFAHVWIISSLVLFGVAILQGIRIKNELFTYISSFGMLSFVLALQNSTGFRQEMYIFGAQLTAMILFLTGMLLPKNNTVLNKLYKLPLTISGNIITPVSLFYFLYTANGNGTLHSVTTGTGVLLAALYYLFSYLSDFRTHWLVICELLLPLGLFFTMRGIGIEVNLAYFILGFVSVAYLMLSYLFAELGKFEERDCTGFISLCLSIILYYAVVLEPRVQPEVRTMLALLPVIVSGLNALQTGASLYIIPLSVFWSIFSGEYFSINHINSVSFQGMWYLVSGEIWYLVFTYLKPIKTQSKQLGYLAAACFFTVSIFLSGNTVPYGLITAAVLSVTVLHASLNYKMDKLFLFFCFSVYWLVWKCMETAGVSGIYVPFVFTGMSLILYAIKDTVPDPYGYPTRLASYVGILAGSLGTYQGAPTQLIVSRNNQELLQTYGLWNSYAASAFLMLDAFVRKSKIMPYIASFIFTVTISWQLRQLHITDSLVYENIWGIYFAGLGYFRFRASDQIQAALFDWGGILLLTFPALIRSFGTNSTNAAVTLGAAGIGMFLMGITRNHRKFTYAGIFALVAAVLSQTYSYILGLEKWMVIGVLGLLFLGFAIYLLGNRKETVKQSH